MISLMKRYVVRYSITFSKDGCDDVVVEDQMSVREGSSFFLLDKEEWCVVQDQGTAESYVRVRYDNGESNLTQVPKEVRELHDGIHDTKLRIFRNNSQSVTRQARRKIVFSDRKRLLFRLSLIPIAGFVLMSYAELLWKTNTMEHLFFSFWSFSSSNSMTLELFFLLSIPLVIHIVYIIIDTVKIDKE